MRGHLQRPGRQRVYVALVACVLWLVGLEAAPLAHLARHDRLGLHRHDGAQIILLDALGEDRERIVADEEPPVRVPRGDAHTRLARALDHGHGSQAHHDLAVLAPAIPPHAPLPITRTPLRLVAAVTESPPPAPPPAASARGPPAFSA